MTFASHVNTEFRPQTAWSPDRPETLVICCSDGRWHAQVTEFVQREVSDRADLYAVPGGPAVVDPWSSTFDEARVFEEAMRVFVGYHDLHGVWLIAHEGCAYYRLRHPHLEASAMQLRQEQDMQRARQILSERYPKLAVRRVFAALERDQVVFTTLADGSHDHHASPGG